MKRMMIPLVLLGGLTLAGSASGRRRGRTGHRQAANASKVAIDPVTGKRRPITQAESRALDAQAADQLRTAQRSGKSKGGIRFPASQGESVANAKTVNGITGYQAAADMSARSPRRSAPTARWWSARTVSPRSTQELPNE